MPKENTHIYSSKKFLETIDDGELKKIISDNDKYFYLGSISPDVFSYKKKLEYISDYIHCSGKSNEIIFELLDFCREKNDYKDLAFIFGLLSHFALDIIFHPIIFYFTGDYGDENKNKRQQARILHRHLETYLDKKIAKNYFWNKIDLKILDNSSFNRFIRNKFNIKEEEIKKAYYSNFYANKIFKSKVAYLFFKIAKVFGIIQEEHRGLFYGDLKIKRIELQKKFEYRNLVSGEIKSSSINELMEEYFVLTNNMIDTAYKYYKKMISKDKALKVLDGRNLITGMIESKKDIRYWSSNVTK